eukprot:TRINITY_DN51167_c0_g1_i1.p1 TRINITY_DN51167_c0_g1~~TRINITY_DN51167_c0_g1_i1.p1  ORF type:complete len:384 (+),score=50.95 TRINITY_DN51167_c0_g1_i1:728-1879(+)
MRHRCSLPDISTTRRLSYSPLRMLSCFLKTVGILVTTSPVVRQTETKLYTIFCRDISGDDWTWQCAADNSLYRIDCVFAPAGWLEHCEASYVESEVDISLERIDHRFVAAVFQKSPVHIGEQIRTKRSVCNAAQLHDEETQHKLREAFRPLPKVPWQVEPTTHVAILQKQIRGVIQDIIPPLVKKITPEWMAADTKAVVEQKRHWFKLRCNAMASMRRNDVSIPFLAWKHMCEVSTNIKDAVTRDAVTPAIDYNAATSHMKVLAKMIRKKTNRDQRKKVDDMCTSMGNDFDAAQMKSGFKTLRMIKPSKSSPPILKKKTDGRMARTFEEAQEAVQEELAEKLQASKQTFSELVGMQRSDAAQGWDDLDDDDVYNDIHSRTQLN